MSDQEKKVFSQELNRDDLKAATGGTHDYWKCADPQTSNCISEQYRKMYGGKGFPNCAATVEDGSDCGNNDACFKYSVIYSGMDKCNFADCHRSWR